MRKKIILSLAVIVSMLSLTSAITNGGGSPYGQTGSPNDGSNCTKCHVGTATVENFITTNIPASGYIGGTTYTITITAVKSGINKFGFEITAEDSTNAKVGTFAITNTAETKMVIDEVTHTGNGTAATNNQKIWSMDWTAPASGSGDVRFFSAVNAANGNGSNTGDQIILSSILIHEDVTNTIVNTDNEDFISVYPTIASEFITISSAKAIQQISIFDALGKEVYSSSKDKQKKSIKLNISAFNSGIYFVHIKIGIHSKTVKFIKK